MHKKIINIPDFLLARVKHKIFGDLKKMLVSIGKRKFIFAIQHEKNIASCYFKGFFTCKPPLYYDLQIQNVIGKTNMIGTKHY